MKVSIKDLNVAMDLKKIGMELDVYDGDEHLGDLYVTSSGLIWCSGRIRRENGIKISWKEFIKMAKASAE